MSLFILNVPFAIEKHISFSALSSKMNRQFVWQKVMRIKQDLPTYNAPIYLCTECSGVKQDAARTRKKSVRSNLIHNLRSEFDPHRHLRRRASVRQLKVWWTDATLWYFIDFPFIHSHILTSMSIRWGSSPFLSIPSIPFHFQLGKLLVFFIRTK